MICCEGLKENESQRTEITGYVNQPGIQLCIGGSFRLQTLNERKKNLAAEMDGIQKVAQ